MSLLLIGIFYSSEGWNDKKGIQSFVDASVSAGMFLMLRGSCPWARLPRYLVSCYLALIDRV